MKILLIRHFMTRGNLNRCYIGTTDEPLLPGQAPGFVYPPVEAVAASPLRRCQETADLIYPDVKRYVCEDLRECDFGLFENKSYEELKGRPAYERWLLTGGSAPFPKGEGREAFCARSVRGFCRMVDLFAEKGFGSVAFVAHGGTAMAVLDRFARHEEGFYHWQLKNGEAWQVELCEKEWRRGERRFLYPPRHVGRDAPEGM